MMVLLESSDSFGAESVNTPAVLPDIEEIARFLRRFADLMSTGHNADHLLRAAGMLEYLASRTAEAEHSLQQEIIKNEANSSFHDLVALRSADLESAVSGLKDGMAILRGELNEALSAV